MMSPFDKWVQWLCVADKWVLVNGQPVLVSTGPWRAWTGLDFGLGRPRHVSCGEDVHVARSGLLSGSGSRLWAWERLTVVWVVWVHGPHTRSMVGCVHPPFPLLAHGGTSPDGCCSFSLPPLLLLRQHARRRRARAKAPGGGSAWQQGRSMWR